MGTVIHVPVDTWLTLSGLRGLNRQMEKEGPQYSEAIKKNKQVVNYLIKEVLAA